MVEEGISSFPTQRKPFITYLFSLFATNQYFCPNLSGYEAMYSVERHLALLRKSCLSTVMKAPGLYNAQQLSVKWVQTSENRANLFVCSLCERFDFTSKRRNRRISQNWFLDIALLHKGTPQFSVQRSCKGKALFPVAPRAYMTAIKPSNSSIVIANVSSCSWRWA